MTAFCTLSLMILTFDFYIAEDLTQYVILPAFVTITEFKDAETIRSSATAHFVAWTLLGVVTLTFNPMEVK